MRYILAIDQGTSSTRAILYSTQQQVIAVRQYPITSFSPQSNWVEQDPEEIWQKTLQAIQEVSARIDPKHIIACGITNQRETTLIWDKKTGICLAPAIVWQDRRTQAWCDSLREHQAFVQLKTGLQIDPYFSATKLNWLLNHVPQARTMAEKNQLAFGTIDSFLIWRLTGGQSHLTDITNASRTLLFNINEHVWDTQLLALFSVPAHILPNVLACDASFGVINKQILGAEIPITGVAGDQQAAMVGQRCFKDGDAKATFGTGGFLMLNTGTAPVFSKHHLLATIAYQMQGKIAYGLEGSIYHTGTVIKWLRDELKLIDSTQETAALANSLQGNDGVYLVPSFTGLGAPHWSPTKGAAILGLSTNSTRAHIVRAALESVCYQTRDILECMQGENAQPLTLLRVDGGMAVNEWLLQFLASLCNMRVEQPVYPEITALGAAMLATLGCGESLFMDVLPAPQVRQFLPAKNREAMEESYQGWQQALHRVI